MEITPLVLVFPDPELADRKIRLLLDPRSPLLLEPMFHDLETAGTRMVDGVKVPFRVHRSRKGGSTVWEFETVEHPRR